MIRLLRREVLYGFALLLSAVYFVLLYSDYSALREVLNREYSRHKEFMFMLNNAGRPGAKASENTVKNLLQSLGLEAKSISETPSGIEVVLAEVHASKVADLVFKLESLGSITSLSAEDNTGQGKFTVRFVVKP